MDYNWLKKTLRGIQKKIYNIFGGANAYCKDLYLLIRNFDSKKEMT